MKHIIKIICLILIVISFTNCKKEDPATIPDVSTAPATNIKATTATAGGSIIFDGGASITANGLCWSTNANPSVSDSKTVDAVGASQYVSSLTGLSEGTTYHIRAYATNVVGTAYGADLTFTTLGEAPSSLTQPVTNVTTTSATLNGTVNPNHLSTTVTFEYGTTTSYGNTVTATQSPVTGNSMLNVNVDISGLSPGTTYHFRIKTVNSLGTIYGGDMSFTTPGAAPICITQDPINITSSGVTLTGLVNPNGLATTVTFEYGLTTNYGNTVTANQSPVMGSEELNVNADITGLAASTEYYARIIVTNSEGTAVGDPVSFVTASYSAAINEQIISSGKTGFGSYVAVHGNLAVIGAGWEDTQQANEAGAVYVYEYNGSQWTEVQRITNPGGTYDDIFGQSVATNGTYIVITEPNARSTHIYSKSGNTWVLEKTFTVTNVSSERYGISCDIYDNTVVIGSGSVFALSCSAIGSAYVYEKNGREWINTAILTPSGGLAHDCFGTSVSIYGNTIAVGASRSSCYLSEQGYVSIFEKTGNIWLETKKINAPDGTGERFGEFLDIENDRLVISYRSHYTNVGGVCCYEKEGSWNFKQKITSPLGNDSFGGPVSLSNNYFLVGANSYSETHSHQGAAYLYEYDGVDWSEKLKILPSDAEENGAFGISLAIHNNMVIISCGASETKITKAYAYYLR